MGDKKKEKKNINEEVSQEETPDLEQKAEEGRNQEETAPEAGENQKEDAEQKVAQLTDKLMRTAAEFDNYKKRTARERDEFFKVAVCDTVEQLIPVLDNLDRAVVAAEENGDLKALLDGIKMIQKQFVEALNAIGVEKIEAVGQPFDPEKHNAVMTEDSDQPENTVLDELMKGYQYKDKIVRHSMVKVSN